MRPRVSVLAAFAAASFCVGAATTSPAVRPPGGPSAIEAPDRVIEEDDPAWDCTTMGDHQCGSLIYFNLGGELHAFEINAPDRPGCFVEPSSARGGFEVFFYPRISGRDEPLGFEVTCPI